MNASIRIVPMASKKLLGRDDASDVRCDPVVLSAQVALLDGWDW